jgi:prevent-host-death family protein
MEIREIGAFEAKARLSELLEQVSRGRVYRITKRGKAVAELRPVTTGAGRPVFGVDRSRIRIGADFEAPLDDFRNYR